MGISQMATNGRISMISNVLKQMARRISDIIWITLIEMLCLSSFKHVYWLPFNIISMSSIMSLGVGRLVIYDHHCGDKVQHLSRRQDMQIVIAVSTVVSISTEFYCQGKCSSCSQTVWPASRLRGQAHIWEHMLEQQRAPWNDPTGSCLVTRREDSEPALISVNFSFLLRLSKVKYVLLG